MVLYMYCTNRRTPYIAAPGGLMYGTPAGARERGAQTV